MLVLRVLAVLAGVVLVVSVLASAIKTVVVPRSVSSVITRAVFISLRRIFFTLAPARLPFERRDRILVFYAPLALLVLPGVWVAIVIVGFTLVYWATGITPIREAFLTSGSSMLTLGFERPPGLGHDVLVFVEATLGLGLVALLISYLPTMYGAFNRRETLVGLMEGRAGVPPSATTLLVRYRIIGILDLVDTELFPRWEEWFSDVEESHTSLPALVFFRSPRPDRSWVTAAGCLLDTAAIVHSTLDRPPSPTAALTMRTGFLCLRRIADYFAIPYDPDPDPADPISVTRDEYDEVCRRLEEAGIPLRRDRDQAWRDFAGWRVNYDRVLLQLAALVVAPPAPWISDRAVIRPQPRLFRRVVVRHEPSGPPTR